MFENFPYTNFHELNLDWIIQKIKECYSPDNPPDNLVLSVNGQTGEVILYQDAEVVFPAVDSQAWEIKRFVDGNHTVGIAFQKNSPAMRLNGSTWYDIYDEGNPPPYPVTSVNGQTGAVTLSAVTSVNGRTGAVTGVYDTSNPPPYPVTSVNGQTGAVTITIPVTSVNGQTGAVTVPVAFKNNSANYLEPTTDSTVNEWGLQRGVTSGSCGISFEIENGHVVGYLNFTDTNDQVIDSLKILTPADIPSGSGVVSINGATGVVTLYGSDINMASDNSTKVNTAITNNATNIGNLENGMAYVETGATASRQLPGGSFVYWQGTMYRANTTISQGATLSSSNLTEVTTGALNSILNQIDGMIKTASITSGVTDANGDYAIPTDILAVNAHPLVVKTSLSSYYANVYYSPYDQKYMIRLQAWTNNNAPANGTTFTATVYYI